MKIEAINYDKIISKENLAKLHESTMINGVFYDSITKMFYKNGEKLVEEFETEEILDESGTWYRRAIGDFEIVPLEDGFMVDDLIDFSYQLANKDQVLDAIKDEQKRYKEWEALTHYKYAPIFPATNASYTNCQLAHLSTKEKFIDFFKQYGISVYQDSLPNYWITEPIRFYDFIFTVGFDGRSYISYCVTVEELEKLLIKHKEEIKKLEEYLLKMDNL